MANGKYENTLEISNELEEAGYSIAFDINAVVE